MIDRLADDGNWLEILSSIPGLRILSWNVGGVYIEEFGTGSVPVLRPGIRLRWPELSPISKAMLSSSELKHMSLNIAETYSP